MSDKAEDDLIALVASEQRGFRRILFAGLAVLIALVAMSAALGVYYYNVAQEVSQTSRALQREAFDARIRADQQNNRVRAQEIAIRRIYDEVRVGAGAPAPRPTAALDAVRVYLQRGQHALADERLIEATAQNGAVAGAAQQIVLGGAALLAWERSGEMIQAGAGPLPERLIAAETAFRQALADPALAPLAQNGVAWVRYLHASSVKSNYAQADCEAVFAAVAASAVGSTPGPQPLYWRAQCERKLGRTREALRDYALALADYSEGAALAQEEITLAMNAYHGTGTVLIALFDAPDDAEMRGALDLASRACGAGAEGEASPRMRLALACLDRAIALRERLRQTDNQISGSGENKGFAYLRDGDFTSAFHNAATVERTGLFAWNELVRALAAGRLDTPEAAAARRDALRNISFFRVGQFNVCELRALLSREMFAEAQKIISGQHKGETVACA
jgi:hypothetical protein